MSKLTLQRIANLKKEGAPKIVVEHLMRQHKRTAKPYRIVVRKKGEKRGHVVDRRLKMSTARKSAERIIASMPMGTVVIIYVQCPSMPLDARYYVKDYNGEVYQSRARVYSKEARKRLTYSQRYEEYGRTGDVTVLTLAPMPEDQLYTQKWLHVKALVDKFHHSKIGE